MTCTSARLSALALLTSVWFADLSGAEPLKAVQGSLFSPASVPTLGTLAAGAGSTVTFDTGAGGAEPSVSGATNGKGALGLSASGQVQVAVFAFDRISLGEGATVVVKGDRGLVLISRSGIAVDTVISVGGGAGLVKSGEPQAVADGGPGAEGGTYGKTLSSAPPPPDAGNGGPPMKDSGQPGRGFGAGFNQRVKGATPGGGGAYGGAGGDTSEGSSGGGSATPRPMKGGTTYGDPALADLFGGSGGAGASNDRGTDLGGGGGGGGAIALIALTEITIGAKGAILATGGAGAPHATGGGGGSGGAILLAAPVVKTSPGAQISVQGGAGATGGPNIAGNIARGTGRRHSGSGGGGGGGRIAIYARDDFGKPGKNQVEATVPVSLPCNVDGGNGGYMAKDGQSGTLFDGAWPDLK